MDSPFSAALVIAASMLVAVLGLLLVRRHLDIAWLKRQHEVASYFFLMIGTLYAVLIAFAIFVVWSSFKDAGTNLQHEANEVGDLSRMSVVMPDPLRQNIRGALIEYLSAVTQDEFAAMAEGRSSERTWQAVEKLWDVYATAQPEGAKAQIYYAESLKHLNELSDYRRTRIFTSRGTVPAALWCLLIAGGILLIGFTYFFAHDSNLWQGAMTAALAGVLSFSSVLILCLDSPYSGVAQVTPEPFKVELEHIRGR